jgi:preprotein translocase SecE subunit
VAKKNANKEKTVTRISASDKEPKVSSAKKTKSKAIKSVKKPTDGMAEENKGFLGSILGYFTGAWYELRQVRWPNRRATWSLTGAVLLFTLFFVAFIVLLDAIFKYGFELILK